MVLESANCTECRSEIWHDDNYCQECGVRTSMLSQRDTQWRKAPSGPSWSREDREPIAPSWKKPESNWAKPVETPIRSFVQSASEQSISSQSLPVQPAVPINTTPVTPEAPKVEPKPELKVEKPVEVKLPPPPVPPEAVSPPIVPPVKPVAPPEPKKIEPVVTKPEVKEPTESKLVEIKAIPKVVDFEKIEEDVDDSILKARWTALESPLLRPRVSDDVQNRKSPEEVVHKIKITNILWLCVCFLAGILIYCLFDIVKMTILKPETTAAKQTIVAPAAPTAPQESKAVETPVIEPVAETKLPEPTAVTTPAPAKTIVPVKSVSVHPTVPVAKPTKPVSSLAPAKVQAKPVAKAVPAKPAIAPESVLPKSTSDASNARARTVWQASSTAIKAAPAARAAVKPSHVVTSKGNGTDLTRYNRLLADYFSRAGNGSFGDESSEPPTYTEWLGRGKPEF
ncbi:MAG: hypothetical protein K2Y22_02585 [Candidatus Obscuribacterales bacterium]|nr:hypothetical protein [Candidatus Obscuribacterales bacterium]